MQTRFSGYQAMNNTEINKNKHKISTDDITFHHVTYMSIVYACAECLIRHPAAIVRTGNILYEIWIRGLSSYKAVTSCLIISLRQPDIK